VLAQETEMALNYYAHSLEGKPKEEWQKLEDHLFEVAEKARTFAEPFGSGDWAWK
jgi:CRISPR-associated endonuclease/helicase Cas3